MTYVYERNSTFEIKHVFSLLFKKNSFVDFQDDIFLPHFSLLKCVYAITV